MVEANKEEKAAAMKAMMEASAKADASTKKAAEEKAVAEKAKADAA